MTLTRDASYCTSSFWGPRREPASALARRWLATVSELQALHPALAAWFKGVDGRGVPLTLEPKAIEADIAENDKGDGYSFSAKSDISGRSPQLFELNMSAGSDWQNVVVFGTDYWSVPDPSVVTYQIFRAGLLIIADKFDVERSWAYPIKLLDYRQRPSNPYPPFHIAWISYCAPRIADLVQPPSTAIVERRPDGGLLMAATDETFDVDNPAHMAVARDIEAAVAPLNCTQPWVPEIRHGREVDRRRRDMNDA